MFESDGIYYRRKNNHLVIAGVSELIKSDIVIPNEINGCPIKEVDTCAFQNVDELDSISFSSTMEVIGEKAFYNCTNLKLVCFLGNDHQTIRIKHLAFAHCEKLESINGGVNILLEGDHIFEKCYGLTKMPPQLRGEIPIGTFSGCRYLRILFFHNIQMVHRGAFLDCKNVEKAFILTIIFDNLNKSSKDTIFAPDSTYSSSE